LTRSHLDVRPALVEPVEDAEACQERGFWELVSRGFLENAASRALCRSLPFRYRAASVKVTAERHEPPPKITCMRYELRIVTDEPPVRVERLHRNIQRYGTVTDTLAAACDLQGTITAITSDTPRWHYQAKSLQSPWCRSPHLPATRGAEPSAQTRDGGGTQKASRHRSGLTSH
jgi:hypothetical protein